MYNIYTIYKYVKACESIFIRDDVIIVISRMNMLVDALIEGKHLLGWLEVIAINAVTCHVPPYMENCCKKWLFHSISNSVFDQVHVGETPLNSCVAEWK